MANVVCTLYDIPEEGLSLQLDDAPYISRAGSGNTPKFVEAYTKICRELQIPLADMCPNREKAFGSGCTGTILGINFDTATLSWSILEEKAKGIKEWVDQFLTAKTCKLKEAQTLHGKLNDLAQMLPFAAGFRFNLLELLREFGGDESGRRLVKGELKQDLMFWANCIEAARSGLPLAAEPCGPPIVTKNFVSDAAGAAMEWDNGQWANHSIDGDRGVAAVGFDESGINFVGGTKWPMNLLRIRKDRNGKFFGSKSTFLETVGLLVPFITCPNEVRNQFVRLFIDNTNVIYAWNKRSCTKDAETSVLIRTLHLIEAKLECKITVEYMRRMSTPEATLADHLSRTSSTTAEDAEKIAHLNWRELSGPLKEWLKDPRVDWNLPVKIIEHL